MFQVRKAKDRGHFNHGWLDTYHTFSFGDYHDPQWMGFRTLRVINEDVVQPDEGFGTHGHRDMEIITYLISGSLEHKDSMGTGSIISPGEVQYMSAGKGVTHSEFNHSKTEPVHLTQIWILPNERSATPRYDQKKFDPKDFKNQWKLVASRDGAHGSIHIRQDAKMYVTRLEKEVPLNFQFSPKRHGWLHVVKGQLSMGDYDLSQGDGLLISDETILTLKSLSDSAEAILFDLN